MDYKDFVKECMNLPSDSTQFGFWLENCQFKLKDLNAKGAVKEIDSPDLTMTAAAIKKCLSYILQKENQVESSANDDSFKAFKKNLNIIDKELQESLQNTKSEYDPNPSTLLESYEKKVADINQQLKGLQSTVSNQMVTTDSKLFSTIINMIAILGIFVAISFAGFGSVSLISKIDINMTNAMIESTFFIALVGLLIYNFLLLLIYIILKIVNTNLPRDDNKRGSGVINKFLIGVDVALCLIVLALFFYALRSR